MFATFNDTVLRTVIGTFGTVICAGVCLIAATAPANAADAPRARIVSYSDLNLASDRGRVALDMRIQSAARAVCASGLNDLRSRTEEIRCVRNAVSAAKPRKVAAAHAYQG